MAELAPEEVDLRGDWVVQKDRSVVADATEQRIEWLSTQKLERLAIDFDFARPWQKSFPLTYALGSHDTSLFGGQ